MIAITTEEWEQEVDFLIRGHNAKRNKLFCKKYYSSNREAQVAYSRNYRQACPEKVKASRRANYLKCRLDRLEYNKQRRRSNPEAVRAINRASYWKHREEILARRRAEAKTRKAVA